jgi:hypothetical protein
MSNRFYGVSTLAATDPTYATLPISLLFLREESCWQRYLSSYLQDESGNMRYSASNPLHRKFHFFQNEDVRAATEQIIAITERLAEVYALPSESTRHILEGFA